MFSKIVYYVLISLLFIAPLCAKDIILEFKGAGFFPTNDCFKGIYGKSGALWGAELTFQLCDDFYGFASIDYFQKKGTSIGLCNDTKVQLVPMALGLKYIRPCQWMDWYLGLGFQPTYISTNNCSEYVLTKQSRWGFGGVVKGGTYIDLSCNFVLDLFVGYSFVKAGCKPICAQNVVPLKVNVSGVILGGGIGYKF
jgi:hypothetical protein